MQHSVDNGNYSENLKRRRQRMVWRWFQKCNEGLRNTSIDRKSGLVRISVVDDEVMCNSINVQICLKSTRDLSAEVALSVCDEYSIYGCRPSGAYYIIHWL
jgi:hypothetical protein